MKPAHEHPDTAEVIVDVRFAQVAAAFALVAFGVPLLMALCR